MPKQALPVNDGVRPNEVNPARLLEGIDPKTSKGVLEDSWVGAATKSGSGAGASLSAWNYRKPAIGDSLSAFLVRTAGLEGKKLSQFVRKTSVFRPVPVPCKLGFS